MRRIGLWIVSPIVIWGGGTRRWNTPSEEGWKRVADLLGERRAAARLQRPLRAIGVILCAVLSAGCPGRSDTAGPRGAVRARTVELVVPDVAGLKEALRPLADEWAAQTGHRVVLKSRGPAAAARSGRDGAVAPPQGEHEPAASGRPDGEGAADERSATVDGRLVITSLPDVATWEALHGAGGGGEAGRRLAAIPESIRQDALMAWLDFFAGLRHISMRGNDPVLAPLKAPVLVLYYRRDLLEAAGLKPPETWDDYRRLVVSLPRWAPGRTAVEPWAPEFRATMFLARALAYARHVGNYSLFFDIQDGRPLIDRPGFTRALAVTREILENLPRDVLGMTPRDCRDAFLGGRAALAIACEESLEAALRRVAAVRRSEDGETERAVGGTERLERPDELVAGFAALPGTHEMFNVRTDRWEERPDGEVNRPTLIGFGSWAMIVPQIDREGDAAAWDLAAFLSTRQDSQTFPAELKGLCRESQVTTFPDQLSTAWEAAERTRYVVTVAAELRRREVVIELPVLGGDRFRAALTDGLTAALERGSSPEKALAAVADRWRAIRDEFGPLRVLNSYRLSLGLDPLVRLPAGSPEPRR
ncbi:MAG: extracellular solute-binding protein [Planctomycetota bacterium]|nr:MAG: extracellular solute-binding protein [Planctomycetota bacterium]